MRRASLAVILLFSAVGAPACGTAPARARAPSTYQPVTTSRILDDPGFPHTPALHDSLRFDVSGDEGQMADAFAERIDRETRSCTVRKIAHAKGSPEVSVDLGLGCRAGAGAFSVRFVKLDEERAALDFSFRDFYQDGDLLDGDVSAETFDGRLFRFGRMPVKSLDPPAWMPSASGATATASSGRVGTTVAGVADFISVMLFRVILPIVVQF